jgi:hypothetical protein
MRREDRRRDHLTKRIVLVCVLAVLVAGTSSISRAAGEPIVTVIRHGGLCVSGSECRSVLRIGDTSVSAAGYVTRPLAAPERAALLRAIDALDLGVLRKHPFKGTCPTAYDGTESIYRFRGFAYPLAGCTYDLRQVAAVRLTDRLLASLKPR